MATAFGPDIGFMFRTTSGLAWFGFEPTDARLGLEALGFGLRMVEGVIIIILYIYIYIYIYFYIYFIYFVYLFRLTYIYIYMHYIYIYSKI